MAGAGWSQLGSGARDGLAGYLDEQGVRYEPFRDLLDVTEALRRQELEEVVDRR